jgi:hypothetical protein
MSPLQIKPGQWRLLGGFLLVVGIVVWIFAHPAEPVKSWIDFTSGLLVGFGGALFIASFGAQ